MDYWVVILLVSIIGLVRSDDNVAVESETNYQVRLAPDFPRKVEHGKHKLAKNLREPQTFGTESNFEKNIKLGKYSVHNDDPSSIRDKLNQKPTSEIPDGVGAATQQVLLLQPQQLYQEQQMSYQLAAQPENHEYVYQNKEYPQEGYVSEYSKTIEHVSDNDEDYKNAIQQGSVGDIKRIVPKSTVSFKMYHNDKGRNGKTEKVKSEYQTNVFHEIPVATVQQETEDAAKLQIQETHSGLEESKHTLVYPTTNAPTQTAFIHSTAAVPALPNNYLQPDQVGGLSKFLSKTAGNFRIVAANPDYEMYKHKINNPGEQQQSLVQNQGFANQQNFFKHVQALHQFEAGLSDPLTQPSKVVELPQHNPHFEGNSGQQIKVFGHNHLKELKHPGKKIPKGYKDKKHWEKQKIPVGHHNHNIHQIQGQQETYTTLPESQILHKAPVLTESYGIPIVKHELSQKPANSPVSLAGSLPLTAEDYMAKYQRDVALIQNSWKTFKQANQFQVNGNQNSGATILSKPPDSIHFEVNPLIDVGKNVDQGKFDHQKALEGSTTFDLKHAIGIVNGEKDSTMDSIHAPNLVSGVTLSPFDKQTTPFAFPLTQKSPLAISQNHFHGDSLTSNSELKQSSLASALPDNKFIYEFKNLPELNVKNKQLAKLVGGQFHDQLTSFNHQLKLQTPLKGFSSGFYPEIQNQNFLSSNVKPVREHSFEQKKNNALVLQNHKLMPLANIDWSSTNTKLGQPKKILIHSDLIPLMQEPVKTIIPILMKKRKNRSYNEGNGVYLKLVKKSRNSNGHGKLVNESDFDLMQVDSRKVNKYKKNERKNEFPVSAFYKIDKRSKRSENRIRS